MPTNFATEDTPAQFSRNESLSDLSDVGEKLVNDGQVSARDEAINDGKLVIRQTYFNFLY